MIVYKHNLQNILQTQQDDWKMFTILGHYVEF